MAALPRNLTTGGAILFVVFLAALLGPMIAPFPYDATDFTAPAPNRVWVADATRIPCGEGVFWLAAVRDAFSNRIVGWKTSDRCDTDLVLAALGPLACNQCFQVHIRNFHIVNYGS